MRGLLGRRCPSGIEPERVFVGQDPLVPVLELRGLLVAADGGRVDLVLDVEDVLLARGYVAELEREAAVAAGLSERARLDRVHGQALEPASAQHEGRVLQVTASRDGEARLEEQSTPNRRWHMDLERGSARGRIRGRGPLAKRVQQREQRDRPEQ